MAKAVPIEKLEELGLIKLEHFSTGKPFETIRTWFVLRNDHRHGWSFPPSGSYGENTLVDYHWQVQMFRGDWNKYATVAGFVDDGREITIPEPWEVD